MHRQIVIAAVPVTLVGIVQSGALTLLPLLAISLATACAWSLAFARLRGRAIDPVWLPAGWLFALLVPAGIGPGYAIAALSFGLVFGCHAFGGSGRYLVSPVLLGAVFLSTAYPDTIDAAALAGADASVLFPLACLAGAVWLVAVRAASLAILIGGLGGLAVTGAALGELALGWQLATGHFALVLAFIATDPTTRPQTTAGMWACGILFGALAIGLKLANPDLPESSWAALLLASLSAPALDRLPTLSRTNRGVADHG